MKPPGRKHIWIGFAVGAAMAAGAFGAVSSAAQNGSATRTRMRGVFVTVTTAYKYSLDPQAFEDPGNRNKIQSSLQALVANTSELERHGIELDPSFDYLKRSLAQDASEALTRFEQGQYMGSRWMLNKLVENCVTCHSKLPADKKVDIGAAFMKDAEVKSLDPLPRAELEIATRRFDAAIGTYEKVFADPSVSPQTISITGAFENYLRLCISVRREPDRAVRSLATFAARDDVPENLRSLVREWIRSLGAVDLGVAAADGLTVGRREIDEARARIRYPKDRTRQVEFIWAAALLHQFLRETEPGDARAAEAYYLLGVAESYISRSYWISETDYLLELAIRQAPHTQMARDAYAFLEEYTLAGHTVTARAVPEEVEKRLAELRALAD